MHTWDSLKYIISSIHAIFYRVIVAFTSTNGGYVKVADREQNVWDKVTNTYYYNGQTATREFEYHWDLVDPVHCSVTSGTSCSSFVSTATDITNNVRCFDKSTILFFL